MRLLREAREAQGMNEARVRHLTHFLEHVQIGAPEVEDGVAAVGRIVTVEGGRTRRPAEELRW